MTVLAVLAIGVMAYGLVCIVLDLVNIFMILTKGISNGSSR